MFKLENEANSIQMLETSSVTFSLARERGRLSQVGREIKKLPRRSSEA